MLRKILLVEDHPNDLELTLIALKRARVANEVVVARDGVEALDWLLCRGLYAQRPQKHPALVLLDLKLPRLDGLEVLSIIKNEPLLKHVPVVMLTTSREESDLVRSYDRGVNAFVVKPVDLDEFFMAIQNLGLFWGVLNETSPGTVIVAPMMEAPA